MLATIALAGALASCTGSVEDGATGGTTPPASRLVVAVVGDFGAGTPAQRRIARRMCAVRRRTGFRDVLTTGDNFYNPDGVATRENYYDPEACLYGHRRHRWRAVWGDHDLRGRSTRRVLGVKEKWYAWSSGGVDFFALDTNQAGSDEQEAWLEERLAGSSAAVKVVYFHHPAFASGNNEDDPEVQARWVPLFEEHDVTLVLNGDHHVYERHRVNGVDYVITGGGGQFLHRCARQHHPERITCIPKHHFLLLAFEGDTVVVRAIQMGGGELDRFTIEA